jgi:hypothetical protein
MQVLEPGAEILFPNTDAGAQLFDCMRRAGVLRRIWPFTPKNHTQWCTWGEQLEDGSILAHIATEREILDAYCGYRNIA